MELQLPAVRRPAPAASCSAHARTQSSIAVSADGESGCCSTHRPTSASRSAATPQLHPRGGLRDTPIKAVVLMDAQIDHVTGLLGLREGPCIDVYATPCVFEDLTTGLPLLNVLQHYCGTRWHMLPVAGEQTRAEFRIDGFASLRFTRAGHPRHGAALFAASPRAAGGRQHRARSSKT